MNLGDIVFGDAMVALGLYLVAYTAWIVYVMALQACPWLHVMVRSLCAR